MRQSARVGLTQPPPPLMAGVLPPPAGDDARYLAATVGDALAKGVAATAAAQPGDPVGYLAQWLLRCAPRGTHA